MHLAAEKGKHLRLRPLLKTGNVNAFNDSGVTPLWLASGNGHLTCVEMLLEAKAQVDLVGDTFTTPLMHAAKEGHIEVLRALIAAGADVNFIDVFRKSVLCYACDSSTKDHIVSELLASGAKVNLPGVKTAPVDTACRYIGSKSVKILIDAGADVTGVNEALCTACTFNDYDTVKMLLDAKAEVNNNRDMAATALQCATIYGKIAIVKMLLDHKADVNGLDDQRTAAIHLALHGGHDQVKAMISSRGVNLDNPHNSVRFGQHSDYMSILRLLIAEKADVNIADFKGYTPLITAATACNPDAVKILLDAGAALEDCNENGATALACAATKGCLEAVELLIDANADIDSNGAHGSSPLACALIFKSEDVALRLIQAGADVNGIVNECAMLDFAAMLGLSKVTAELKKRNAQSFYELMFAYSKYARAGALGQMQVAECILYEGAEKPSEQHLALCVAVYSGHREFVKALLDGGVDPSCVRGGHSALMVACMRGHRGIAQDLIRAKADVSAKNVLNFTAMQLAARFKHRDIVQLLLNRGKK